MMNFDPSKQKNGLTESEESIFYVAECNRLHINCASSQISLTYN